MSMCNKFLVALGASFLAFCISSQPANAQYVEGNKVLTAGQEVIIAAPSSDSLEITYRPGSDIGQTKIIPRVDSSYRWKPERAGIFSISTPNGPSQTVSVRFNHFPLPGLIVLMVAGFILFGGAIFSAINLFGKP